MGKPRRAVTAAPALPPPAPNAAYTLREAARAAGVAVRTVRYYVERRALPRPDFKSTLTRYDRTFVIRLRAIARLRKKRLRLDAIQRRLEAASPDELLAIAGYALPSAPAPTPAQAPSTTLPAGFLGPYRAGLQYPAERWDHLPICPGVVLLVKSEGDPESTRVAREIVALFGKAPNG